MGSPGRNWHRDTNRFQLPSRGGPVLAGKSIGRRSFGRDCCPIPATTLIPGPDWTVREPGALVGKDRTDPAAVRGDGPWGMHRTGRKARLTGKRRRDYRVRDDSDRSVFAGARSGAQAAGALTGLNGPSVRPNSVGRIFERRPEFATAVPVGEQRPVGMQPGYSVATRLDCEFIDAGEPDHLLQVRDRTGGFVRPARPCCSPRNPEHLPAAAGRPPVASVDEPPALMPVPGNVRERHRPRILQVPGRHRLRPFDAAAVRASRPDRSFAAEDRHRGSRQRSARCAIGWVIGAGQAVPHRQLPPLQGAGQALHVGGPIGRQVPPLARVGDHVE